MKTLIVLEIRYRIRMGYLLSFLMVYSLCALGQINFKDPKVVIPDETKIIRFQDYPMDYSTGLPDITIPLWEVKIGDIVLPITLKYHAAGFRPCENYSNVGLGWSLFAEPNFSQNVRGGLDGYVRRSQFGYDKIDLQNAWSKSMDEQSDIYRYRLINNSGVCLWEQNPNFFMTYPYEDIDISRSSGINPNFTLKDPQGIRYFFDGLKEYDANYNETKGSLSYMCKYIYSINNPKHQINFSYNTSGRSQSYYVSREQFYMEKDPNDKLTVKIQNLIFGGIWTYKRENGIESWRQESVNIPILSNVSTVNIRDLTQITTPNEVVDFYMKSMWIKQPYNFGGDYEIKVISKINVKRASDGFMIRSILFNYDTFSDYYPKLKSINIGFEGKSQSYVFDYNEDNNSFPSNANRIDQCVDDYGFYNGQVGSYPDFYAVKVNTTTYGTVWATATPGKASVYNRPPIEYTRYSTQDAKLYTLKSIKLPTGGLIKYEYEGNSTEEDNKTITAGLRVAQIIEQDSGQYRLRRFVYQDNDGHSYGRLFRKVEDFYFYTNHINNVTYQLYTIFRSPLIPLGYNKAPILYQQVDEYIGDPNKNITMKIERKYKTADYYEPSGFVFKDEISTGYVSPSDFLSQTQFGQILHETHYNQVSGQYKKVKSVDFDYDMNILKGNYGKVREREVYLRNAQTDIMDYPLKYSDIYIGDYNIMDFELETSCIKPKSKRTVLYDAQEDTISCLTEIYNYGTIHTYPVLTEQESVYAPISEEEADLPIEPLRRVGSVRTSQHLIYPQDIPNHPLREVNCYSSPVQITDSVNGKYTQRTLKEYENRKIGDASFVVQSKAKFFYDPLLKDSIVGYYDAYDELGNILEMHKENYPKTVFHWSTYGRDVIARFDNYTLIQLKSNTALLDALGRLEKFKDEFSDVTVRSALQSVNAQIRSLVPSSVKVTTYTYRPLVGMTSQTDPNGRTIYYEYDWWYELKNIRNHNYQIEKSFKLNIQNTE